VALIEIQELSKEFVRGSEIIRALDHVSLTIAAGELLSIVGPSGSGKSTLLYVLGLIDTPSSGHYRLNNQEVAGIDDQKRAQLRNQELGFVFQSFHLLARATALRNVSMPLTYATISGSPIPAKEMAKRAREALITVGLADRLDHLPNQLSGGQRQRVAIARALVNRPKIIFADEPTGNLDSRSGGEIMSLFEQLNQAGVTIIIVTHDHAIAQRTSRQISLRDGKIEKDSNAIK
jgi:putative ABC transport system ATP-binding protein